MDPDPLPLVGTIITKQGTQLRAYPTDSAEHSQRFRHVPPSSIPLNADYATKSGIRQGKFRHPNEMPSASGCKPEGAPNRHWIDHGLQS